MQHYKGFIEVSKCLIALRDKISQVSQNLDNLQEELPKMDEACAEFTKGAQTHAEKQTKNKQLLSKAFHTDSAEGTLPITTSH